MYLIVYLARYFLDVFTTFNSLYDTLMKIFYITSTAAIIIRILRFSEEAQSTRYSPTHDSFEHWKYLLIPSVIIGYQTHLTIGSGGYCCGPFPFTWSQSLYMLPQLILFRSDRLVKEEDRGDARDEIVVPVFLFGIYRAFYILNWIYRANTEKHYRHHWVVYVCGYLQVLRCIPNSFDCMFPLHHPGASAQRGHHSCNGVLTDNLHCLRALGSRVTDCSLISVGAKQ